MLARRLGILFTTAVAALATAGPAGALTTPNLCIGATGSGDWCGDGLAATHAKIAGPHDVAPLPGGGYLVADSVNHVIRRVDAGGAISTIAGTGLVGYPIYGTDAATNDLGTPMGVAPLPGGGYLIADAGLRAVLRVTPDDRIVAAAGHQAGTGAGDGGPASAGRLRSPRDIAVLPGGAYLIVDADDNRVRRVRTDGVIETFAGTGERGFTGDGGPATVARLSQPTALSVATDGSILVADRGNLRIRRIDTDGRISTVAGGGAGDTPALAADLAFPTAVGATPDGGFLVGEAGAIRQVSAAGAITTVAGIGTAGFNVQRAQAPATAVALAYPTAVAALGGGRALVADTLNDRVRLLDLGRSALTTVAGSGVPGEPGEPEPIPSALLEPPRPPGVSAPLAAPRDLTASAAAAAGPAAALRARAAQSSRCYGPTDRDPRPFSTPYIVPQNPRVLPAKRRVSFKYTLSQSARLVATLTRSGRRLGFISRQVNAAPKARSIAFRGTVKPGTYRLDLQMTAKKRFRRCLSRTLRVRR